VQPSTQSPVEQPHSVVKGEETANKKTPPLQPHSVAKSEETADKKLPPLELSPQQQQEAELADFLVAHSTSGISFPVVPDYPPAAFGTRHLSVASVTHENHAGSGQRVTFTAGDVIVDSRSRYAPRGVVAAILVAGTGVEKLLNGVAQTSQSQHVQLLVVNQPVALNSKAHTLPISKALLPGPQAAGQPQEAVRATADEYKLATAAAGRWLAEEDARLRAEAALAVQTAALKQAQAEAAAAAAVAAAKSGSALGKRTRSATAATFAVQADGALSVSPLKRETEVPEPKRKRSKLPGQPSDAEDFEMAATGTASSDQSQRGKKGKGKSRSRSKSTHRIKCERSSPSASPPPVYSAPAPADGASSVAGLQFMLLQQQQQQQQQQQMHDRQMSDLRVMNERLAARLQDLEHGPAHLPPPSMPPASAQLGYYPFGAVPPMMPLAAAGMPSPFMPPLAAATAASVPAAFGGAATPAAQIFLMPSLAGGPTSGSPATAGASPTISNEGVNALASILSALTRR
jgi:hypothetical protein